MAEAAYRVVGIGREVYKWGEDGMGDHVGWSPVDYLNVIVENLEALDGWLAGHCLPPLKEWSADPDDDRGYYDINMGEDEDGNIVGKDAAYIADYCIRVERLEIEPYIREDG